MKSGCSNTMLGCVLPACSHQVMVTAEDQQTLGRKEAQCIQETFIPKTQLSSQLNASMSLLAQHELYSDEEPKSQNKYQGNFLSSPWLFFREPLNCPQQDDRMVLSSAPGSRLKSDLQIKQGGDELMLPRNKFSKGRLFSVCLWLHFNDEETNEGKSFRASFLPYYIQQGMVWWSEGGILQHFHLPNLCI